MSSLIVEVCKIDKITSHPNADRMEIAQVKGWQVCVGKGQHQVGDKIIYIPPDSVLPQELADRWGVTKYLAVLPVDSTGVRPGGGRVQVARLRGQPSYGFVMPVEDPSWEVGKDLIDILGITKWEPPLDCTDGDADRPHPAFHHYFNLERIQNFPEVFQDGEEVVMTEKIHGKNCRLGLIREAKDDGSMIWRFMTGSNDVRRKEMTTMRKRRVIRNADGTPVMEKVMRKVIDKETGIETEAEVEREAEFFYEVTKRSQFWDALDKPGIKELLLNLSNGQHNVVIFAELFGSGVQDMTYGFENGNFDVRVFDITIDGKYMSVDDKFKACNDHKVVTVPILYRGPFSQAAVDAHVDGPTTLCAPERAGNFKGREGVVITSVQERSVATEKKFFDRASLKAISFAYEDRKDGTEYH